MPRTAATKPERQTPAAVTVDLDQAVTAAIAHVAALTDEQRTIAADTAAAAAAGHLDRLVHLRQRADQLPTEIFVGKVRMLNAQIAVADRDANLVTDDHLEQLYADVVNAGAALDAARTALMNASAARQDAIYSRGRLQSAGRLLRRDLAELIAAEQPTVAPVVHSLPHAPHRQGAR